MGAEGAIFCNVCGMGQDALGVAVSALEWLFVHRFVTQFCAIALRVVQESGLGIVCH